MSLTGIPEKRQDGESMRDALNRSRFGDAEQAEESPAAATSTVRSGRRPGKTKVTQD